MKLTHKTSSGVEIYPFQVSDSYMITTGLDTMIITETQFRELVQYGYAKFTNENKEGK